VKNITVNTGFGYYTDSQGHVTGKAELPPGVHPMKDGFSYTEVADAAALELINIYVDPAEIEQRQNEQKIQARIRTTAIESLIATGDLPPDYVDKV